MHHGTPQQSRNRPTRANYALWNVAWSPRVLDIWEKRSKTADPDRRPWPTISKRNITLGNATINRYFVVGTINRISRLKPVNCSTKFTAVLTTRPGTGWDHVRLSWRRFYIGKYYAVTFYKYKVPAPGSRSGRGTFSRCFAFGVSKHVNPIGLTCLGGVTREVRKIP
jgi:hypothetical protein